VDGFWNAVRCYGINRAFAMPHCFVMSTSSLPVSIGRFVVGRSRGRTMKIWFQLLLLIVAGNEAVAQDIVVKGNRRIEAESIRLFFHQNARGKLDNLAIDNALKGLYATGLYQEVNIKQNDGHVVVTVVEALVINRVAFEGNKRLTDDQLSAAIQSKSRGTFLRPVVQQDVQHIIERYHDAGRAHARIDPQIVELPDHRVDLIFKINEGERTSGTWFQDIGDALGIHSER
jgi:outer membrane protein insertion porin family